MASALCSSAEMFGQSPHQIRFVTCGINTIWSSGFALKQAEAALSFRVAECNNFTSLLFVCDK
jgi:hypothetical protein